MSKFEVGQRVRFHGRDDDGTEFDSALRVEYPEDAACLGQVGTVSQSEGGRNCRVLMDSGHVVWGWLDNRYEAVQHEPVAPPAETPLPDGWAAWSRFLARSGKLKFRSGCAVTFVAYEPRAKPHCQLILLNPATGNIVTRYANGESSEEPYAEPGDILVAV